MRNATGNSFRNNPVLIYSSGVVYCNTSHFLARRNTPSEIPPKKKQ